MYGSWQRRCGSSSLGCVISALSCCFQLPRPARAQQPFGSDVEADEPVQPVPPAPRFREGAYRFSTPDFLDCTGPAFGDTWDKFYKKVLRWEDVMHHYYRATREFVDVTPEVREMFSDMDRAVNAILEQWVPVAKVQGARGWDAVLRGDKPAESLGQFCMYGLVQALWIRAQLLMLLSTADRVVGEAMMELHTAHMVLGEDFRADYMDSTRWPVRSLDVAFSVKRGALTKVPKYNHVVNEPAHRRWEQEEVGVDFFAAPSRGPDFRVIQVAIFGSHGALASEPVTMVRGSLPEWQVVARWYLSTCRFQDPRHHYMCRLNCHLFGECIYREDPHHLPRRLLTLVDFAAEGVGDPEKLAEDASMPRLLDIASEMFETDPALSQCDLVITTIPLMASLLRAVSTTPIFGYFSMAHYLGANERGLADWALMHLAEMGQNTRKNVFAYQCHLLADIGVYQLGIRFPVVRPFGLYIHGRDAHRMFPHAFDRLLPGSGKWGTNVVVPRSNLVMSSSFLHALRVFTEAAEPEFPLNFTVIRSSKDPFQGDIDFALNPPPEGERLRDVLSKDGNVFLDFRKMSQFRAALSLPQSSNMMSLYEMMSMHLPQYIPAQDWLYRIYHQRHIFLNEEDLWAQPTPQKRYRRMRPGAGREGTGEIWGTDNTFLVWNLLFEKRFESHKPGIRTFDNFPDLLHKLLYDDLDAMREDMRRDNEIEFAQVVHWYRSAVMHLLLGPA